MNALAHITLAGLLLLLGQIQPAAVNPHVGKIDSARSTITVRVYKSGFLSAFGHDHEIQAPIESGEVKEPHASFGF